MIKNFGCQEHAESRSRSTYWASNISRAYLVMCIPGNRYARSNHLIDRRTGGSLANWVIWSLITLRGITPLIHTNFTSDYHRIPCFCQPSISRNEQEERAMRWRFIRYAPVQKKKEKQGKGKITIIPPTKDAKRGIWCLTWWHPRLLLKSLNCKAWRKFQLHHPVEVSTSGRWLPCVCVSAITTIHSLQMESWGTLTALTD